MLSPPFIFDPVYALLVAVLAVKELLLLEDGAYLKGIDNCCFILLVGSRKPASFMDAELLLMTKFCGQGSSSS